MKKDFITDSYAAHIMNAQPILINYPTTKLFQFKSGLNKTSDKEGDLLKILRKIEIAVENPIPSSEINIEFPFYSPFVTRQTKADRIKINHTKMICEFLIFGKEVEINGNKYFDGIFTRNQLLDLLDKDIFIVWNDYYYHYDNNYNGFHQMISNINYFLK